MRTARFFITGVFVLFMAACTNKPTPTISPHPPTVTQPPTLTIAPPTATKVATPTNTSTATSTTIPTTTPTHTPSSTPAPTITITPTPKPLETLVYVEPSTDGFPIYRYITWSNSDGSGKKQINYFFYPSDAWDGFAFYVANPIISPDGRYMAAKVHDVFYVADLQTNENLFVIGGSLGHTGEWHPASWEPTGQRLVVSYGDQLVIWNADTRQAHRFETPFEDLTPAWSPTGEYIAFNRYKDKVTFEMIENNIGKLCIMKPDGSGLRVLSEQAFFQEITPLNNYQSLTNILSWSPDGQWVAFLSSEPPDIVIVNIQNGETRLLAPDPAQDLNPDWSPDGKRIAFVGNRNGRDQIFTIGVDGNDLINLTPDLEDNAYAPVWSPSGQYIAFLIRGENEMPDGLYVMNADGSGKTLIQGGVTQRPAWSPIPAP